MRQIRSILAATVLLATSVSAVTTARADDERYPYRSPALGRFVADSYAVAGSGRRPEQFYRWMDAAFANSGPGGLDGFLAARRRQIGAAKTPDERARLETALAAALHARIKTRIPKFSLDRGFEFTSVVDRGERQCLLQSVLVASALQAANVDAGVVMVYRSVKGEESNNGHAVTLLKRSDGKDMVVDVSDPHPFALQRGLFVRQRGGGGYHFVEPVYDADATIRTYKLAGTENRTADARALRPLDVAFLRSQFDYYRGERRGGYLFSTETKMTPAGLATAAKYLERSVRACPSNPLPVFVLGRVYERQRKTAQARAQYENAYRLYTRYGWIPPDPKQDYARTRPASGQPVATNR